MQDVYIVSVARTPVGCFGGNLASLTAPQLGALAIKAALERSGIAAELVNEVFMGNVLSANIGQAPVTQAMLGAGIGNEVPSTTINKVCASGMKAMMLGAQTIMNGDNDIVIAGGMESMSHTPYYMDKARNGFKYGHGSIIDGIIKDGLWDPYGNVHMGNCGETCATKFGFTREQQDEYAVQSYTKAALAYKNNYLSNEIAPVSIAGKEPVIITEDEQYKKVKFDKIPSLKPAFVKEGTITAANASPLSDGASAVVLMSGSKMKELGLKAIAKIIGLADAAQAPEWFTTAPSLAIPKALAKAGLTIADIDYWELNEAFAVVVLANTQLMQIPAEKINVWGGAIALGHALGSSGCRITITLSSILSQMNGKYGVAAICNGGGGASAIVIEKM
jgi:acetyl-CoA C-acetyltransferase